MVRRFVVFLLGLLIIQPAVGQSLIRITGTYWSSDGNLLIVTTSHDIIAYDVTMDSPEVVWSVDISIDGDARALTLSPSGRWIATGHAPSRENSGMVNVWNTYTGEQVARFRGNPAGVYSIAFSPDETSLAVGGGEWWIPIEDYVTFWNTVSWQEQATLRLDGNGIVSDVEYSPNGRWLTYTTDYGGTYLVDAQTLVRQAAIIEGAGHVTFSEDSSRLIVRTNHLATWEIRETPEIHLVRIAEIGLFPHRPLSPGVEIIGFSNTAYITTNREGELVVRPIDALAGQWVFSHVEADRRFISGRFSLDQKRIALISRPLVDNTGFNNANEVAIWTLEGGKYIKLDIVPE